MRVFIVVITGSKIGNLQKWVSSAKNLILNTIRYFWYSTYFLSGWDSFLIQIGPWKCFVLFLANQSIVCTHQVWFQNELNMLPIYINRRPYHISVSWRNGVFGWWLICIFSSQTDTAKGRCQARNVEGWICDTTSLSGGIPLVKIRNSFFFCGGTDRCVSFVIDIIVLSFSKRNLDNQGEVQLLHSLISTYFVVDMFFWV